MNNNQRKFVWGILAVLLSSILWLYVTSSLDIESSKEIRGIRIEWIGEEVLRSRNLSVIENITGTVRANVNGRRTDYVHVDNSNVYAEVDLSTITETGIVRRAYDVILPNEFRNSLRISDRNPVYVDLFIDRMDSKFIEVRLVSNIKTADGFIAYQGSIEPYEVRLRGPSTILANIEYAEVTLTLDEADRTIDSVVTYKLIDIDGNEVIDDNITLDVPEVRLYVPILKTKSVALGVDFRDGGGLTLTDNINYSIRPETITISGEAAVVNGINEIKLGLIDLSKVESSRNLEFNIVLPNDSNSVSGEETAVVTIEIVGARTTVIVTTNIEIINAEPPDGFSVLTNKNESTVHIRGPDNLIGLVTPYNVRVVVDLAGQELNPGHMLWPATVYIDGVPRVGAVGDYSVPVEIVAIG
jgi:YbbR domain-containing protein